MATFKESGRLYIYFIGFWEFKKKIMPVFNDQPKIEA